MGYYIYVLATHSGCIVKKTAICLFLFLFFTQALYPQSSSLEKLQRQLDEKSQVFLLAKKIAQFPSRLTNSPNLLKARSACAATLESWGLQHVKEESWGEFGPGWNCGKYSLEMISPRKKQLKALPKAWSKSLNSTLSTSVCYLKIESLLELQQYKDRLKGQIVVLDFPRQQFQADNYAGRAGVLSEEYLRSLEGILPHYELNYLEAYPGTEFNKDTIYQFLHEEKPLLVLEKAHLRNGLELVGGYADVDLSNRSYAAMWLYQDSFEELVKMLEAGEQIKLKAEMETKLFEKSTEGINLIAELEGESDEMVLVGAHLDSVYASSGATDNAAGAAIAMEAMRLLKSSKLKMKRTIRLILWDGEEQGMLGSLGYIRKHLLSNRSAYSEEHARISAYFNIDHGTGRIRGINTQNNYQVIPFFRKVFQKLNDPAVQTVSPRLSPGSDHLSFDGVGIPSFNFIQDPLYYHSSFHRASDTWQMLNEKDLKQASLVVAWTLYCTANAKEKLPRQKYERSELPPGSELRKLEGEYVLDSGLRFSLYVEKSKLYFHSQGYRDLQLFFQGFDNYIVPELGVKLRFGKDSIELETSSGEVISGVRKN